MSSSPERERAHEPGAVVEEDINSAEARTEGAMDVADVIATRQNLMSPTYASFQTFNEPVVLESAFMQYCYGPAPADSYSTGGGDGESGSPPGRGGVKYTDLLASNLTISVGHAHPRVLHAAKAQMDKAPHLSSMYYTEPVARLTKKLLATFPPRSDGEKWQVLYAVTGTEAVELALQLARVATGNIPVLSMTNSYHGSCGVAMGCSGTAACRHPFPETGGILHLPSPINLPAGEAERSQAVTALVQSARDTVMSSTCGKVSSFIFEPLQGYGGIHVLPPEYLQQMSEVTRQHGGLVIADEIQTGLGRMGHPNFWGYQMSGIEPDVVIVGKGLGNGFPISAVVCKESVFARFAETKKFIFSTYGANCVAAAVASEVLDILRDEQVPRRVAYLGSIVSKHLHQVMECFEDCIDVRGCGLMWGVELTPAVAFDVFTALKDCHYLVGLGGRQKNVLRVMSPMCIEESDLDRFALQLNETLQALSRPRVTPLQSLACTAAATILQAQGQAKPDTEVQ